MNKALFCSIILWAGLVLLAGNAIVREPDVFDAEKGLPISTNAEFCFPPGRSDCWGVYSWCGVLHDLPYFTAMMAGPDGRWCVMSLPSGQDGGSGFCTPDARNVLWKHDENGDGDVDLEDFAVMQRRLKK